MVDDAGDPVFHTSPSAIPAELLASAHRARSIDPLCTLFLVAVAVAWTVAGFARHDVPAYGLGALWTGVAIVSIWGLASDAC